MISARCDSLGYLGDQGRRSYVGAIGCNDLVEHLLLKPNVSAAFCEQDDVGHAVGKAKTTVDDVVNHFREHAPMILVGEAESYAWTGVGRHPSITLKRELVHATYTNGIEFSRY